MIALKLDPSAITKRNTCLNRLRGKREKKKFSGKRGKDTHSISSDQPNKVPTKKPYSPLTIQSYFQPYKPGNLCHLRTNEDISPPTFS